jgi:hypothetical protein
MESNVVRADDPEARTPVVVPLMNVRRLFGLDGCELLGRMTLGVSFGHDGATGVAAVYVGRTKVVT